MGLYFHNDSIKIIKYKSVKMLYWSVVEFAVILDMVNAQNSREASERKV